MTSTIDRSARAVRAPRPGGAGEAHSWLPGVLRPFAARFDSPVTSYYVLIGVTTALLLIGLVMDLSATMVTYYKDDGST